MYKIKSLLKVGRKTIINNINKNARDNIVNGAGSSKFEKHMNNEQKNAMNLGESGNINLDDINNRNNKSAEHAYDQEISSMKKKNLNEKSYDDKEKDRKNENDEIDELSLKNKENLSKNLKNDNVDYDAKKKQDFNTYDGFSYVYLEETVSIRDNSNNYDYDTNEKTMKRDNNYNNYNNSNSKRNKEDYFNKHEKYDKKGEEEKDFSNDKLKNRKL